MSGVYAELTSAVLQYRRAYYETRGHIAPEPGLPTARAWPRSDANMSYNDKLTQLLPLSDGIGAEIGPLNIPTLLKTQCRVLYVDHLDTEGLRAKYPYLKDEIIPIDRPMLNASLQDTLASDAPLDFVLASQVFEHVPDPIRWLQEIESILRIDGLLSLSLPDRRCTFDLFREETRPCDIIAAYFNEDKVPNVQCVYDNQSLATAINLEFLNLDSFSAQQVVEGKGSILPTKVAKDHLSLVKLANEGHYLDTHCWVFTPPSFLLTMAQLVSDGFFHFKCFQFYPTTPLFPDRGNSSFSIILQKVSRDTPVDEMRQSFLQALGE